MMYTSRRSSSHKKLSYYSSQNPSSRQFVSKSVRTIPKKSSKQKPKQIVINKTNPKYILELNNYLKNKQKQQQFYSSLPKMIKGKLHLGQINKPLIIIKSQYKHNPWLEPNPIDQFLINQKGLMSMMEMGIIPKSANCTQLLNTKYQSKKKSFIYSSNRTDQHSNNQIFFATTSQLPQFNKISNKNQLLPVRNKITISNWKKQKKQQQQHQKIRKTLKINPNPILTYKSPKTIQQQQPQFFLPPQIPILQLSNKKIQKNQQYYHQLKQSKIKGYQITFKFYLSKIQQFSSKYHLQKFQFLLYLDPCRKLSNSVILTKIINAKALGIYSSVKGKLQQKAYHVACLLAARFKYKKMKTNLLKIQNIKQFYKTKKFQLLMSQQRTHFYKNILIQFSKNQHQYLQLSQKPPQKSQKLRLQIHIISLSDTSYENQQSYYQLQSRNNIQLTRLFNQQCQYLILLIQQNQYNLTPWLQLLNKLTPQQNRPIIIPLFSKFSSTNSKITSYNSIYYGLDKFTIKLIKKICGNKSNCCIYPSSFNHTLVKICQLLNVKLYCGGFWEPHREKLVAKEDQCHEERQSKQWLKSVLQAQIKCKSSQTSKIQLLSSNSINPKLSNPKNQAIHPSNSQPTQHSYTLSQLKHLFQKTKKKQLNNYELISQHYSNKLHIKSDLLIKQKFPTPQSLLLQPQLSQQQFYKKITKYLIQHKTITKWVFKLSTSNRLSRGLAFLQTIQQKIIKQYKKKIICTSHDLQSIYLIIKIILIDKLELPQNSLHQSAQFLQLFRIYGGYIEPFIQSTTTQCLFGKISPSGHYTITGTYTKIYTNNFINCASIYPSNQITSQIISKCIQLSSILYNKYQIFGHVTYQILINKNNKSQPTQQYYFIDLILSLQQYSSLYFMYNAIFNYKNKQPQQKDKIIFHKNQSKSRQKEKPSKKQNSHKQQKKQSNKKQSPSSNQCQQQHQIFQENKKTITNTQQQSLKLPTMKSKLIYFPFLDNNGNTFSSFHQFQAALKQKHIKQLNFDKLQGIKFLYLNLSQQIPNILSMLIFSKTYKQLLQQSLNGLNFIIQTSEQIHKFTKSIKTKKCDYIYLQDIIWKFRQLKKSIHHSTLIPYQPS